MPQIRFRFARVSRLLSLKLVLIGSLFSLLLTPQVLLAKGIPQRWEAREYQPPGDLSTPNRTAGAGTRSPTTRCPVTGTPLTASPPPSRRTSAQPSRGRRHAPSDKWLSCDWQPSNILTPHQSFWGDGDWVS